MWWWWWEEEEEEEEEVGYVELAEQVASSVPARGAQGVGGPREAVMGEA